MQSEQSSVEAKGISRGLWDAVSLPPGVWPRSFSILRLAVFYGSLFATWQIVYKLEIWSPFLLPEPQQVYESLRRYADNGVLFEALQATVGRMVIGFTLAFSLGMLIGIANATVRWLDETLGGLVVAMQTLPSVTWLPLAILWFGLTEDAIIFVVVMGSVWSIAISARDGVRSIPVLQRRTAMVFGASRWQTIRYVTLPGMLPSMAQGLKLGWAFSWRSLMAAELLYATTSLGHLLQVGRDLNNMSLVIGIMIVIVAVGMTFDRLFFAPIEKWVHRRWGLERV